MRVDLGDQPLEGYAERMAAASRFHAALSQLEGSAGTQRQLDRRGDPVAVAGGLELLRADLAALNEAHRVGLALGADRLQHVADFVGRVAARLAAG